jgi:heat shock protein HslJ
MLSDEDIMRQITFLRSIAYPILVALLLGGCQAGSEPTPTPEPAERAAQAASNLSLVGSSWQAESLGGPEDSLAILPDTRPTVNFGVDRYAGSGGCNWFLGVYEAAGETLRFMTPSTTRTVCGEPAGVMEQEATYMSALLNIIEYRMEGEKLLGYTTNDQLLLTFVPASSIALEGTTWQLKFLVDVESVLATPVIPGTEVTAQFTADRMSGSGGCNTYEAAYTLDDESFAIADLTTTEMACAEPEGIQEQEQRFLAYLQIAAKLVHVGGAVLLQDALGRTLLAFGAE